MTIMKRAIIGVNTENRLKQLLSLKDSGLRFCHTDSVADLGRNIYLYGLPGILLVLRRTKEDYCFVA